MGLEQVGKAISEVVKSTAEIAKSASKDIDKRIDVKNINLNKQESYGNKDNVDKRIDVNRRKEIKKALENYINDLQNYITDNNSIYINVKDLRKLNIEELKAVRKYFEYNKDKIIKEWEVKNNRSWPKYEEDIYIDGKKVRKKGDRYDAHHIHPLGLGGKNSVDNIMPMHVKDHYDKQGVHSKNSAYAELLKSVI